MREILFKAKRIDNGEWVEGYFVRFYSNGDYKPSYMIFVNYEDEKRSQAYSIIPETICQYTGLTDKNCEKIWENDIVSNEWCFACGNSVVRFGEYKDFHMPETFQCGNLGFYLEHKHKRNKNCRKDMMYFAGKCEVIGNVLDNPELLEQEETE